MEGHLQILVTVSDPYNGGTCIKCRAVGHWREAGSSIVLLHLILRCNHGIIHCGCLSEGRRHTTAKHSKPLKSISRCNHAVIRCGYPSEGCWRIIAYQVMQIMNNEGRSFYTRIRMEGLSAGRLQVLGESRKHAG